jgi:cytochrome c oxidase subunit IV
MAETHPLPAPEKGDEAQTLYVRQDVTLDQELEVESHAPYLRVWFALLVFTLIEYFYAKFTQDAFLVLVLGLMFWAIIKASLVGWYFMHLKFEGRWVYYMLIPAGILAAVFIFALYPDMALHPVTEENPPEDEVSAPLNPGPAVRVALRS